MSEKEDESGFKVVDLEPWDEIEKIYKMRAKEGNVITTIMKEAEEIRKERKRRYLRAAAFISLGLLLLFISLPVLLERISIPPLSYSVLFVFLTVAGAISFGYGFYRMGVS